MNSLKEYLKDKDGGAILDVATGHGDFLKYICDNFKSYSKAVGADISTERLEKARERYPDFIFEANEVDKLNYADNSFDTVSISHSLHHLREPRIILEEMKRVLKPGGLFIVCEVFQTTENEKPNSQRHLHHYWAKTDQLKGVAHFETYTPDQIKEITAFLNLKELDSFIEPEEASEEELNQATAMMIKHTGQIAADLKEAGEHLELAEYGEELVERFKEQGVTFEDALCIVGFK